MTINLKKTSFNQNYSRIINRSLLSFKANKEFLFHFLTGQFLLQFLNLVNGFFLLRWLSVSQQAKFSIAFGIQTLILTLSDLGFTGSIIALTGNRIHEKETIGAYIQSAKRLRNYLFWFSCILALVLLPYIVHRQEWSNTELGVILIPVFLSVFWQADASLFDSALIMHKKMKELYVPQLGIAAMKLASNFLLYLTSMVGALSTLIVNAVALFLTARVFKKQAKPFIKFPDRDIKMEKAEMTRYLKPLFPSLIFNALYGQIQIFLISFFGKTSNIAEVSALGRLGQLFVFLGTVNAVVIGPLIARSPSQSVSKKFFMILTFSTLAAGCIFLLSVMAPGLFLILLGPKYSHLSAILPITILSSCTTYVGSVIWAMNSARKWIFWWGSIAYISVITICQIIGILFLDLSYTKGILELSLLTAVVVLIVQLCISVVGFRKLNKQQSLIHL